MSSQGKRRSGATTYGSDRSSRIEKNSREKSRHRALMRCLDELVDELPIDKRIFKTRISQLNRIIAYFYYLEDTVQAICKQQGIPLPADYQRLLANRSCQSKGNCKCRIALARRAAAFIECNYAQSTAGEGQDAVVPDIEFPPDMPSSRERETGEWERYGISKEDWMAAGSSQQNTPQSPNWSANMWPEKTFVDVMCSSSTATPLKEAPEYFIVSPNGDVTSLGTLSSLPEHQGTERSFP
ncbi:uncharacterized protein LOC119167418 [Rhipicephalus microplus]|uniref:uncharacterized protein LOC119167418 n=1 Tax=Rhipicephalus microplus TaxID=6941 RepID=UPI003F6A70B1